MSGKRKEQERIIKPLYDKVLILPTEKRVRKSGNIIIPDSVKEKPQEGEIRAVGNGAVKKDGGLRPLTDRAGGRVFFSRYGGEEIELDGVIYVLMKEEEILALLPKTDRKGREKK